ncbi:MAG: 30S ribosomal protein S17 [Candidatus Riflebacteria bacterium]|nr:30S ribosomal protein S17 [Candidatus Riflebacteria bacterium]
MENKENLKARRKTRVGRVIATNSIKTIKVEVDTIVQHPRYRKFIKRAQTFMVHDPKQECTLGDKIRIEECKPVSKLKNWVVREILEHASARDLNAAKEATNDSSGINS